jgi:hypothetical protein
LTAPAGAPCSSPASRITDAMWRIRRHGEIIVGHDLMVV